jgi:hypothetical protein
VAGQRFSLDNDASQSRAIIQVCSDEPTTAGTFLRSCDQAQSGMKKIANLLLVRAYK